MIMLQIYGMYAPKTSASDNFYKIGFRMRCQRRKILLMILLTVFALFQIGKKINSINPQFLFFLQSF